MKNNSKQVLHMQPRKGFTTAQSNEHQRRWTEAGWENAIAHGNYDRARERLNFEIRKGGIVCPIDKSKSLPERMAENLRQRGIKDPNEGRKEPKFRTIAERRVKGLHTMINNLVEERTAIEAEIESLKEQLATDKDKQSDIMRRISELKVRLLSTSDKLADKEEKLRNADHTLAELTTAQSDMQSVIAKLREEAHELLNETQNAALVRISDTLLGQSLLVIKRLLPTLDAEQRRMFDAPMFEAWAKNGMEMMKCSIMLFLGYVDQATQIAESNGGGGESSDLEWGRKPDEDDRMWALRCIREAHRLMLPAPRTSRGFHR